MIKSDYKENIPYRCFNPYKGVFEEYTTPGLYRHRYNRGFRYPRTHQERKANERDKQYVRAKRRKLPSSWDDISATFIRGKCWKRFTKKRKQYL
jgi:hypothetical protein